MKTTANNPATDMASNLFGDLTKSLEQFKVPGIDMSGIVESRRKDIAALVAANQVTLDSMQALAKKQAEVLAQAMQGVQEAAKTLGAGGATPDPAKYTEFARKAYDKAVADMKEMAEMARKAQTDVMTGIGARAAQSLQEIKAMAQPEK